MFFELKFCIFENPSCVNKRFKMRKEERVEVSWRPLIPVGSHRLILLLTLTVSMPHLQIVEN